MHGRLDTSRPELSEWIVLASPEGGRSHRLAWEKEPTHSLGRWLWAGAAVPDWGVTIQGPLPFDLKEGVWCLGLTMPKECSAFHALSAALCCFYHRKSFFGVKVGVAWSCAHL